MLYKITVQATVPGRSMECMKRAVVVPVAAVMYFTEDYNT